MSEAELVDVDVDMKGGEIMRVNDSEPFLRRKGQKTSKKSGLLEGECLNCGVEISINESGICEYCKACIWSGKYD